MPRSPFLTYFDAMTTADKQAPAGVAEIHTYGVQFIDLEPTHYTLLQNLTYEALIADRQKIV